MPQKVTHALRYAVMERITEAILVTIATLTLVMAALAPARLKPIGNALEVQPQLRTLAQTSVETT